MAPDSGGGRRRLQMKKNWTWWKGVSFLLSACIFYFNVGILLKFYSTFMEKQPGNESFKGGSPKHLPTYFECMTSEGVDGFNTNSIPRAELMGSNTPSRLHPASESHARSHSILMSLPSSPSALDIEQSKGVMLKPEPDISNEQLQHKEGTNDFSPLTRRKAQFHSQSLDICFSSVEDKLPKNERLENKRYNSFKTWSGKLESQLSTLSGRQPDPVMVSGPQDRAEALPEVERYFDALEGPELETLRASEELVLPEDKKWPFLLRFPISSFGMCLGVSSQAILWKNLATTPSMSFLNVNPVVNLVLWCTALALMGLVASIYAFKVIFFFEAVRREYYHPVRVNFFFAPWIACLFLAIGVPPHVSKNLHAASWYVLMAPILCLELKIYGQWMSGGQRRLSKVANPSNHLSIVGNFVGALLGASMGLKEGPVFFFAVGLAHYTVLFVTLYQRLPTNETLPKELHPVFFLFIAAPSVACMAWANITGSFDLGSRIAYFTALFLYASLAVRINFFRGFRFSLAWWAYTFPMTGAAIATIRYTVEVNNVLTRTLAVGLSTISAVTVSALLISTILHAFVFHNLFPNDIAIAITHKRPKSSKKHSQIRTACVSQDDWEP